MSKTAKPKPDFHRQTVLFQWSLSRLGVNNLADFCHRFQITPDSPDGLPGPLPRPIRKTTNLALAGNEAKNSAKEPNGESNSFRFFRKTRFTPPPGGGRRPSHATAKP